MAETDQVRSCRGQRQRIGTCPRLTGRSSGKDFRKQSARQRAALLAPRTHDHATCAPVSTSVPAPIGAVCQHGTQPSETVQTDGHRSSHR